MNVTRANSPLFPIMQKGTDMPYSSNVWRECTPPESSAIGPDALKQIEARHAAAGVPHWFTHGFTRRFALAVIALNFIIVAVAALRMAARAGFLPW